MDPAVMTDFVAVLQDGLHRVWIGFHAPSRNKEALFEPEAFIGVQYPGDGHRGPVAPHGDGMQPVR